MAGKEKYTPVLHDSIIPTVQRQTSLGATFDEESPKNVGGNLKIQMADEAVASLGQPTTLECQVLPWSEERHGHVRWLHDGLACEGDEYLFLSEGGQRFLYIKDTAVNDGGCYTVVAKDGETTVQKSMEVRIAQPELQKG